MDFMMDSMKESCVSWLSCIEEHVILTLWTHNPILVTAHFKHRNDNDTDDGAIDGIHDGFNEINTCLILHAGWTDNTLIMITQPRFGKITFQDWKW